MNCKKNANSNPREEKQLFHTESEKVVEIGLERLRPFKNHPFKVKEDEAMAQLMESIERYGIMNPLIVMPTREGVYQIVSGHRRKYCAEKLGYTQVPVIIRYMKEDDSIISMVDSNLHRDKILFSDNAVELGTYASQLDCEGKNGTAIIIYPNKNMKRKVINLSGVNNENPEQVMTRITNAVYEFSNQVMRLDIDTWEGIQNEKLHFQNGMLLSDRKILEEENAELYEVFEEQLSKTEEINQGLNREIQRLTIENQALRMRLASRDQQPLIYMGEEADFYEGEIREIILEILEDYSRNVQKDTRRDHIVMDLLENNNFEHIPAKRREQIKVALKGYKSLSGSLRGLLESMGFVITDDGKHYKWTYFGDHRYSATMAKTSSDNRAGMNMASLIDNLML